MDRDAQVDDPLARRDDVAVRTSALEDEARVGITGELADDRCRRGRADLFIGVGHERQALERKRLLASRQQRLEGIDGVQAGQQAALHVRDAGSVGASILDSEGALGGGSGFEDRVHVSDQEQARAAGPCPVENADHGVSELLVGMDGDLGSKLAKPRRSPTADFVDSGLRVAPAVDVDQPSQILQEGGESRLNPVPQRGQLIVSHARSCWNSRSALSWRDASSSGRWGSHCSTCSSVSKASANWLNPLARSAARRP